MDTWQRMQTVAHRRHDAEIAATAAERPEQLPVMFGVGRNQAAIRQYDLGFEHIVEREAAASDQRTVAATEREPCHADGCDGTRRCGKMKPLGDRGDIGNT